MLENLLQSVTDAFALHFEVCIVLVLHINTLSGYSTAVFQAAFYDALLSQSNVLIRD